MTGPGWFAIAWKDDPLPGFGPLSPAMKERLIIFGALAVVLVVVVGWALLFRSRRQRSARREERRRRRHSISRSTAKGVAEIREYVKDRQRRRRREHRPRNPTLAETGGLPPVRREDNSPTANPPS